MYKLRTLESDSRCPNVADKKFQIQVHLVPVFCDRLK